MHLVLEEELEFVTGIDDNERGNQFMVLKIVLMSRCDKGCFCRFKDVMESKLAFIKYIFRKKFTNWTQIYNITVV